MSAGTSPRPLLASRDFRLLLVGQTTSQLGAQVSALAVPLVAVVTLGASAFEVGLVSAASTLAFAVIGLPAGAWLDRVRRRPVLVASDVARAVLLLSVPLAALADRLTVAHLVVVSLLAGLARAFFDVGYRSYVPTVVGKDQVLAGNSALELVRASGQVAGPALGGVLVGLLDAANVILVQVAAFVVSAGTLLAIRAEEKPPVATAARPRLRRDIAEGLAHVWRDRFLRATALASALSNVVFAMASSVMFVFMSRTLGLTPAVIGVVLALGAGAVVVGAALTPAASRVLGSARVVWVSLAVCMPLTLAAPLAPRGGAGVVLLVLATAAGELGQIVYAVSSVSVRQRICPDRILGRVNATVTVVVMGLFPVGALAGGVLGDAVGPRTTLLVAGGLSCAAPAVLYAALRRTRTVEDLPVARQE